MKKSIFSILCVLILGIATGCGDKKMITAEEFKTKMEDKGYSVQDATAQFAEYDFINKVYIAMSRDSSYQIEFYTLSNNEKAIEFFNNNKSIFENTKAGSGKEIETSSSMGNNAKYTLNVNNKYKVVSRIDNTVVFADEEDSHKSEIKDVIKELGY